MMEVSSTVMPTAWPVLERAASGEEWPICPVNMYLTRGHSEDLHGDASLSFGATQFRPTPGWPCSNPSWLPSQEHKLHLSLKITMLIISGGKGKRIHWVEQDLVLL